MKAAAARIENLVLSISPFTDMNYQRTYSISSLILMFFTFSGIGWIWEVFLHIIADGMIINRGVLTGPWLPIYGTGGVLILLLLKKWRKRPLILFSLIMLVCGIVEYATSVALESLFGVTWWDYTDMLLHIQGRVCIEGLLIFGIGGLFIVYVAAPKLDNLFQKLSRKTNMILCCILISIFLGDMIRSFITPNMGFGITM